MKQRFFLFAAMAILATLTASLPAATIDELTTTVNAIGLDGQGYPEAVEAVQALSKLDAPAIPQILASFDDEKPIAANWLRAAVEAVAQRGRDAGSPLPEATLVAFINDDSHSAKARGVAFQLLKIQDQAAAKQLIPSFENDPSLELRLLAVDRLMQEAKGQAESDQKQAAIATYRQALTASRNANQANDIAKALKDLGEEVDTSEHFGFVKNWHVIAAFDFAKGDGFDAVYPPETEIDLNARYPSKLLDEIKDPAKWQPLTVEPGKRHVDFNQAFAPVKEVVGYAVTTFDSDEAQDVELRWGSPNGTKVWLNGELVGRNRVYHAGDNFDQYMAKVKLKPGENTILVKVVQNEQTQSWTNVWHFDLRVCDHLGTAIRDAKP
ncbi:hypothetical protein [Blastopirellula marina]|uniref:Glycosyl hydrolases family 2 sugar binding domain-containing protein n=1 Tax=Blastopirellula marina TaxID=124 RepID=A0A2S8GEB0_9BACT|nr:hypothetical protein [Blastopirellula marina]PQO42581.1 hypothetical protein C5Y98_01715 [Blastopirellula marina]PTL46347.1 hypothetical protein C5Y97_01715 [Blastopirellula marina]